MDWSSVSQNAVLLGGFLLTGVASLYRFAGHGRRMAKREHDVVRRLRQADLDNDDPRHNLNLQAWYTDLTGLRYVRALEIRHIIRFTDAQAALTFYASARFNLELLEFGQGHKLVERRRWLRLVISESSRLLNLLAMVGMLLPILLGILGYTKGGLPLSTQALFVAVFAPAWVCSIPGLRFGHAVKRMLQLQAESLADDGVSIVSTEIGAEAGPLRAPAGVHGSVRLREHETDMRRPFLHGPASDASLESSVVDRLGRRPGGRRGDLGGGERSSPTGQGPQGLASDAEGT